GLVWDVSFATLARPREKTAGAWADLAKPEWELAGPSIAALAARPDDLLAAVREQLKAADKPDDDPAELGKLVDQLSDPLFAVRERASAALQRFGREALPALQERLGKATAAEPRQRLQQVMQQIARSPVPSDHLRSGRALALLEQFGTPAARVELTRLA